MVKQTKIVELTRVRCLRGETLHFTFPGGTSRSVRHNVTFVAPEHVPEFEGKKAWFEMERRKGPAWPYWIAIRQVDPPPA